MAGTPLAARARDEPPAPEPERRDETRALILWTVAVVYAGAGLAWGVYLARQALVLIYLSALLAIGLAPFLRFLEHHLVFPGPRRLPRTAVIAIVYVAAVGSGLAIVLLVLPTLLRQAQAFVANLPQLVQQSEHWFVAHGLLQRTMSVQEVVKQAPVDGADAVTALVATLWGVIGGVFGLVTILVLSFYFLLDADAIFRVFIRFFPRRHRMQVRIVAEQITAKVSAWLSGQVFVAALIGGTTAIGLGLMGIPYFYVLALIAGVGETIPVLGPILSSIPAILIAAATSWNLALGVAVFYLVQQQIESQVIVPRLMSSQVGVSSPTVLIALLIGAALFGIVGAILAVPTAAIIQVLFVELVPPPEA
jgi:predicted PurR-regulated permease PerM